jgi:hypothetical protein
MWHIYTVGNNNKHAGFSCKVSGAARKKEKRSFAPAWPSFDVQFG